MSYKLPAAIIKLAHNDPTVYNTIKVAEIRNVSYKHMLEDLVLTLARQKQEYLDLNTRLVQESVPLSMKVNGGKNV